MKTRIALLVVGLFLVAASGALAKDKIPNLLGKWSTESVGGLMVTGEKQSPGTHWVPQQKVLRGQLEITSQDGRFLTGTYTSERGSENFIGMISADGKWMYAADTDGYMDWKIVGKDTMEVLYRHVKATDTVVALGIAKRLKQ